MNIIKTKANFTACSIVLIGLYLVDYFAGIPFRTEFNILLIYTLYQALKIDDLTRYLKNNSKDS